MDTYRALGFLSSLSDNNNREWFSENKTTYEAIKSDMAGFLAVLIPQISDFDPDIHGIRPLDCLFRIYRDVRFSTDKSPYKTNIGAFISHTGIKGSHPGYYIHFEPGRSMVAGGLYMPPPNQLKAVRDEIYFNVENFISIINHPELTNFFPGLDHESKLMRPAKGYPADYQHVDLLKYRSYTVSRTLPDEVLHGTDLNKYLISAFRAMHPLISFLRRATA